MFNMQSELHAEKALLLRPYLQDYLWARMSIALEAKLSSQNWRSRV